MPHLSPMNWILAITMFWVTLSILASTLWWTKHHSFSSSSNYHSPSMQNLWKWF
uniref:ATP synthase F0 subunit 8 n=1 Tax=Eisenia nordenskioldi nordenskioldi TaxID=1269247 RepID=A0A6B9IVP0_9ANNE|nr:ATP synthase F0 subunit 8 [Eisenia nordenskioldi nordenskioldi]